MAQKKPGIFSIVVDIDEEKKNKTIDYFVYLPLKYSKNMVFCGILKEL